MLFDLDKKLYIGTNYQPSDKTKSEELQLIETWWTNDQIEQP